MLQNINSSLSKCSSFRWISTILGYHKPKLDLNDQQNPQLGFALQGAKKTEMVFFLDSQYIADIHTEKINAQSQKNPSPRREIHKFSH